MTVKKRPSADLTADPVSTHASDELPRALRTQPPVRRPGDTIGTRLDPIERAKTKPTSLRFAVTAKCYDCEGADSDPNVRARIGTCGIKDCPLWPVRPFQRSAARFPQASSWQQFHAATAGTMRAPDAPLVRRKLEEKLR